VNDMTIDASIAHEPRGATLRLKLRRREQDGQATVPPAASVGWPEDVLKDPRATPCPRVPGATGKRERLGALAGHATPRSARADQQIRELFGVTPIAARLTPILPPVHRQQPDARP